MKQSYDGKRMTYVLVYSHFTLYCGCLSHVSHLTISDHRSTSLSPLSSTTQYEQPILSVLPPDCTVFEHSPRPPPPAAAAAHTPVRTASRHRPPHLSQDTLTPIPGFYQEEGERGEVSKKSEGFDGDDRASGGQIDRLGEGTLLSAAKM